jgi:hypothetical protein
MIAAAQIDRMEGEGSFIAVTAFVINAGAGLAARITSAG